MGKKQVQFEDALERLEKIVHELEEGEIGLEESLKRYEDGVKLLRQCYAILQNAQRRIELLTGVDENGQPITEPFDATATLERVERKTTKRRSPTGKAAKEEYADGDQESSTGNLF